MGANRALFALMNAQITRQIRNEENRATNCVARNIKRSVDASANFLNILSELHRTGLFDKLSPDLRKTALLREQHPDASLAELAALHQPPLTKSGLNHRLKKITEWSQNHEK